MRPVEVIHRCPRDDAGLSTAGRRLSTGVSPSPNVSACWQVARGHPSEAARIRFMDGEGRPEAGRPSSRCAGQALALPRIRLTVVPQTGHLPLAMFMPVFETSTV